MHIALLVFALVSANGNGKTYHAKLVNCHDGDTCTFDVHLGFGVITRENIRLCDVDAPEMRSGILGPTARTFAINQIYGAKSLSLVVPQVRTCAGYARCEIRSFDRVLAWVFIDGYSLGDVMIEKKLATKAKKQCPRHVGL